MSFLWYWLLQSLTQVPQFDILYIHAANTGKGFNQQDKGLFFIYVYQDHCFSSTKLNLSTKFGITIQISINCLSHCLVESSLGAYCTSQLSPSCVWRACNPMAGCFHMVEQSSTLICSTSRYRLRVLINAFIHPAIVSTIITHQVAVVLSCPEGGTGGLSWYHQYCSPGGNMAHCTRHIVVVNCWEWSIWSLVLGNIYVITFILVTKLVL